MFSKKLARDIGERVAAAALFAGLGVLTTAEGDRIFDPNLWRVFLAAAIGAGLSSLKSAVGSRIGDRTSAALLSGPAPNPAPEG